MHTLWLDFKVSMWFFLSLKRQNDMGRLLQKGPEQKEPVTSDPAHTWWIWKWRSLRTCSPSSGSEIQASSTSINSDMSQMSENGNPWPYMTKDFGFKVRQGDNVFFECIRPEIFTFGDMSLLMLVLVAWVSLLECMQSFPLSTSPETIKNNEIKNTWRASTATASS